MPRLARCRLQQIAVQGDGWGRAYGFGAVVDLDEHLPGGLTLAAALGDRMDGFDLVETVPAGPSAQTDQDEE